MFRQIIWNLIWRCIVGTPIYAVLAMCLGDPPARVRAWAAVFIIFWTAFDLVCMAWSAGVWPWLRLLRLRWPVYVYAPLMIISPRVWTQADMEPLKAIWDGMCVGSHGQFVTVVASHPDIVPRSKRLALMLAIVAMVIAAGVVGYGLAFALPPGFL